MTPTRQSARFSWRSLRTQLIFWNVLALAILLAGLGLVIRYTVVATMISSVDRELDSRTRRGPRDGPGRPPPPLDGRFRRDPRFQGRRPFPLDADDRYRPRRFDRTGKLAEPFGSGSDNASLLDPRAFARALHGGQPVFATVTVNGERLRVLYRPSPSQPPFEGVVQVPYSLTEVDRAIGGLNRALLVLVPVALLCAGAGGAALTDQVL
ncbi:MAG: hypothetical protein H7Z41_13875, partial [Cytophagales bacterium]|nr:hypothetical protein [Armatimonadota bacterium]